MLRFKMKIDFKSQINGYCENDDVWVPKRINLWIEISKFTAMDAKNDNKRGDVEESEVCNESDEDADQIHKSTQKKRDDNQRENV